jgi:hypothetical protein
LGLSTAAFEKYNIYTFDQFMRPPVTICKRNATGQGHLHLSQFACELNLIGDHKFSEDTSDDTGDWFATTEDTSDDAGDWFATTEDTSHDAGDWFAITEDTSDDTGDWFATTFYTSIAGSMIYVNY